MAYRWHMTRLAPPTLDLSVSELIRPPTSQRQQLEGRCCPVVCLCTALQLIWTGAAWILQHMPMSHMHGGCAALDGSSLP